MKDLRIEHCSQDSFRYSLKLDGKEIGYGYIYDREINPIEIYIDEQYRSNGYGKYLFSQLQQIAKERGVGGMIFEVAEANYRFIAIIGQVGAKQIGKNGAAVKFILKIQ